MKTIIGILSLTLALAAGPARGATVYGTVRNRSDAGQRWTVLFKPKTNTLVVLNEILYPRTVVTATATNGSLPDTKLIAGPYWVQLGAEPENTFSIQVPAGTNRYNIANLITNTVLWTNLFTPIYLTSAEKGQAGGVATLDGSGVVPTNQLPLLVSGVSQQQLIGVSNAAALLVGALGTNSTNHAALLVGGLGTNSTNYADTKFAAAQPTNNNLTSLAGGTVPGNLGYTIAVS